MKKKELGCRGDIWIYGAHACFAALSNENRVISRVAMLSSCRGSYDEIAELSKKRGIIVEYCDKGLFLSVFNKDAIHQGVAVLLKDVGKAFLEDLYGDEDDFRPIIMLDHVVDPQNVGAIIRSAAVFDARGIILCNNSSPSISASMIKVASGGFEKVPLVYVANLVNSMNALKKEGFWCIGLSERGSDMITKVDLKRKCVFVIGSEDEGMRRLTEESCDFFVKLPSGHGFSTLNASHSASVVLYEFFRQNMVEK